MRERKHKGEGAVFGLALVVLGVALLLNQLDVADLGSVWRHWPFLVIALGCFKLVTPRSPERVGSGLTEVLFGLWFLACQQHWYGMRWSNSWPLALVAIGSGMVIRGLLERLWPALGAEEVRDEPC